MSQYFRQTLYVLLIVGYTALNGWLPFQAIGHTHDHEHHTAATHATPICSWMCAAGQTTQASDHFLRAESKVIAELELPIPPFVLPILSISHLSRGPPS